jgi:hypothetical protein
MEGSSKCTRTNNIECAFAPVAVAGIRMIRPVKKQIPSLEAPTGFPTSYFTVVHIAVSSIYYAAPTEDPKHAARNK